MFRLPTSVPQFAVGGNEKLYVMFQDYYNEYRSKNGTKNLSFETRNEEGEIISFSEKEKQLNTALKAEIMRVAGINNVNEFPLEVWASHPTLKWASFAVVNQLIDAVLPDTLIDTIGLYTDVRTIGYGDSAAFDIEARDLFIVSKAGRGMRQSEIRKQFKGQVTILPELRELTVSVSLYKVLSGAESLAKFATKAIRSIESQLALDAYNAFATAMGNLTTTAGVTQLKVTGWAVDDFVRLAQKVGAWGSAKPILIGTQRALQNVLPDDANYRYDLSSEFVSMGYIKNVFGYDAIALPQVADWSTEFAVSISDTKLWIIAPGNDKLVKLVLEGSTVANTNGAFDNANLAQNTTLFKSWGVGIATSSLAAEIALS